MLKELNVDGKLKLLQAELKLTEQTSEEAHAVLKQITRVIHRIKFLRTYIKRAFTNSSRTSNLYSVFTKKITTPTFKTIEPYFQSFKKDDTDISSDFWKRVSSETGISVNTCYSMWVNNVEDDFIVPWPRFSGDFMGKEPNGAVDDWLKHGLRLKQAPFRLFQDYMANKIAKQKSKWTVEEDKRLLAAVRECGKGKWGKVASVIKTKNPKQCMHRFRNKLENTKRGKWSLDEDARLVTAVERFGLKKWCKVSEAVLTRNDAQCRERYLNVLSPDVCKAKWTYDEDMELDRLVKRYGEGNWSLISSQLSGRTDAQCRRRHLQLSKLI